MQTSSTKNRALMNDIVFAQQFANELEAEAPSTRKCLERIPPELFGWKPHEKSMELGYLALLVAEIPLWISYIIEQGEVNFATFKHIKPKSTQDLVEHFNANVASAKQSLLNIAEGELANTFYLKNGEQELYKSPKKVQVEAAINHMVHHRGQLTVYMRLNNIAVPSIYGPSADDKSFGADGRGSA